MSNIKIHDINESSKHYTVFSSDLIDLENWEQTQITGGLDPDSGGLALVGISLTAATVGAPFLAGFAMGAGLGLLIFPHLR